MQEGSGQAWPGENAAAPPEFPAPMALLGADGMTNLTDLTLAGDLTVGDDTLVTGDLTVGAFIVPTPAPTATVTMNGSITPAGMVQPLSSAGTVNVSGANVGCGSNGAVVNYVNVGSNNIVITETAPIVTSGNTTLGAGDTLVLQSLWGQCVELAQADN
jgi:hypothetical protein